MKPKYIEQGAIYTNGRGYYRRVTSQAPRFGGSTWSWCDDVEYDSAHLLSLPRHRRTIHPTMLERQVRGSRGRVCSVSTMVQWVRQRVGVRDGDMPLIVKVWLENKEI